jgi:ABC-type uncharacterized transport system involved in gliding motility auxiliary subunit
MAQPTKHRTAIGFTQAAVYTLIVLAILVVLNFLANRYNKSYDTTSNKRFTLSDQTAKIAAGLKQPVVISYWDQPAKFTQARDLLERYKNLSTKIDIQYNDVDKNRLQAKAAGVTAIPAIFVQSGERKQEAKSLTEEEVTGAIVRAIKVGQRTVCFTTGSGEHALDDQNNRDSLSRAKELIEKNNYKTDVLKLVEKREIPTDCTVVVVAGPKHDLLAPEISALKDYVEGGGRVLFMLDPPLKLGGQETDENAALLSVLEGWGVVVRKDLVLDLSGLGQLYNLGPEYALVTTYDNHPIVSSMKDSATGFPLARSIEIKPMDKVMVEKLFETSDQSLATVNLASLANGEVRPSPNDLKGPFTLGVAGTYTTGKENKGLFVVVGASGWVVNGFLPFNGNRDLLVSMLNWLSSDSDLTPIPNKEPEDRRLNMNQRQMSLLFYESVLAIPLLVVVAGISVWWRRR